VVAVRQIEDLAGTGQSEPFTAMIQAAVAQTGRFRVMERDFDQLLGEQQDANNGLVTTNTPGRTGGFEGADFLIYGTITAASSGREADEGAQLGNRLLSPMTRASPAAAAIARAPPSRCYAKSLTQVRGRLRR